MRRIAASIACAALVLSGCTSFSVSTRGSGIALPTSGSNQPSQSNAPNPTLSTPPLARNDAELHIVSGFTTISVVIAAIGTDLYRARTPPGSSGSISATSTNNVVTIAGGGGSNAAVQVVLSPVARWRVSLDAGTSVAVLDLRGGSVAGVDITQGVSSLEIVLPGPTGTTPIAITAGVHQLRVRVHAAAAVAPVRATLSSGAGSVTIDGVAHSGVAGGTVYSSPGWDGATNRIDIACSAGVSALTIDRV